EDRLPQYAPSAPAPSGPTIGLLNCLDQLVLGHRRAAGNVQPTGHLGEVLLTGVGVDALGGVALGVRPAALGPVVGRPRLVLLLPVVADLLVAVLECAVGDPVRPLALAILLLRGVVGLGERALGLVVGLLQGAGQFAVLC